jgi:uncharacterized membrane protein YgdD (TMEM256/DUF423 family)
VTNGPPTFHRPLLGAAGIVGALGVAMAAAASHLGKPDLATAGHFALLHAPALLGLSLFARSRTARAAGWVLTAGLLLFAGDLAARDLTGAALFPLAAPLGGLGLIAGWLLVVATAAFAGRRGASPPG